MIDAPKTVCALGFFFVVSGAEIWPHSQLNLGDFFPNFWDFHSVNTHTQATWWHSCSI